VKAAHTPAVTFAVVRADGGWAVEVRTAGGIDLALFRSQRAKAVTAAGASTAGPAAVLRKRPGAAEDLYAFR
jgi:hypothetical protein